MLVPNMSIEEIAKEVRKDYPILKRKMFYHAHDIKKHLKKETLKQGIEMFFEYRSKYKNRWLYKIICQKKEYDYLAMLIYHNGKGHVGIEVADDGTIIYHTGHFFLRYNERRNLGICVFDDIVKEFMKENFAYQLVYLDKIGPDVHTFFGHVQTGVILGTMNKRVGFARINTFLPEAGLSPNQQEQNARLRVEIEKYKEGANDRL